MTSEEKYQQVLDRVAPKGRADIPIYLNALVYPPAFAGKTLKACVDDVDTWLEAVDYFYENIGKVDVNQTTPPVDVMFVMGLEVRRPGYEIGENEVYQFVETPRMDHDDYEEIIKTGWNQWYNRYLGALQKPPLTTPEAVGQRWMQLGANAGKVGQFLGMRGVAPMAHTCTAPLFDQIGMIRSFEEYCFDLVDEPELVKAVLAKGTPEAIESTLGTCKMVHGSRIGLFAMRSDMNSISPTIFDEFVFPYLRQMIEAFHAAGVKSIIHADGNWLPILDRFLTLPKGSCHFQFDGVTDIFSAYDLLDRWHSMDGDVPATMLAFGTYDETRAYGERLVTELGMKGGFMLAAGCEVPQNAKPENVKALFDSVRG